MLDALQSVPILYCGSNSQKLDVWRTFDFSLEKPCGSGTMSKVCYRSSKGFVIDKSKFFGYCLKPGTTHYDHFAGVGYTMDNADQLFGH